MTVTALKETVYDMVAYDPTLMSTLTGGVYMVAELPPTGISPDYPRTILEDDGVRVKPFGVLVFRGGVPLAPVGLGAEQVALEVWLYQQQGYDAIDAAIERLKTLLDHVGLPVDYNHTRMAWSVYAGDLGEMTAEEYGHISMNRVTFDISILRKRG